MTGLRPGLVANLSPGPLRAVEARKDSCILRSYLINKGPRLLNTATTAAH